MSSVGVNVPVQVTPPSLLLTAVSVPFSSVISLLSKLVTASLKVIVRSRFHQPSESLSDIVTLADDRFLGVDRRSWTLVPPASGALPARSVNVVPTLINVGRILRYRRSV